MAALDLSKPVGPLPLGAWVVVVGAGLAIAYTTRNSTASTTDPTTVTDTSTDPGVGLGGDFLTTTPDTTGTGTTAIADNDQWAKVAIDHLIADGYAPALCYSAITKALGGAKLSVQEYTLWQISLREVGTPPTPVTVVPPTSLPGPGGGTTPPPAGGIKYHTIKNPATTLGNISAAVYGSSDWWPQIRHANAKGTTRTDGTPGFLATTLGKNDKLGGYIGKKLIIPDKYHP